MSTFESVVSVLHPSDRVAARSHLAMAEIADIYFSHACQSGLTQLFALLIAISPGCHRWQGPPSWPPGQCGGQAAPRGPEDRRRPLRSSQHLWRILPLKAYVLPESRGPVGRDAIKRQVGKREHVGEVNGLRCGKGHGYTLWSSGGLQIRRTVKYQAYLRKMTRFNPTRGGKSRPRLPRRTAG